MTAPDDLERRAREFSMKSLHVAVKGAQYPLPLLNIGDLAALLRSVRDEERERAARVADCQHQPDDGHRCPRKDIAKAIREGR